MVDCGIPALVLYQVGQGEDANILPFVMPLSLCGSIIFPGFPQFWAMQEKTSNLLWVFCDGHASITNSGDSYHYEMVRDLFLPLEKSAEMMSQFVTQQIWWKTS